MPTLPKAEPLKRCPKCKQDLLLEKFSHNQSTSDGLATYCKECAKQAQKQYLTKIKNMDQEYRKKIQEIQLRLLHLTTAKNALKRSNYLKNDIDETVIKVVKALSTVQVDFLYEHLYAMIEHEISVQEEKYDKL